jgi:hypothetical protein
VTEKQFTDLVGKMSLADTEALKGGIANKIFEQGQNNRLSPQQFLTPRAQAKLAIAFGPDKAARFIGNLHQEAAMKAFETRAVSAAGSPTAGFNQAMNEQGTFGQSQMAQDVGNAIAKGPRAAAASIVGRQFQKVADDGKGPFACSLGTLAGDGQFDHWNGFSLRGTVPRLAKFVARE